MSVLSRKELRIALCQGHAGVLASVRRLTRRGFRHEVLRQEILPVAAEGDPLAARRPQDAVLRALDAGLADFAGSRLPATVIVSNHFMRYMLVPWSDTLNGEAEQLAYARHLFGEVYGEPARHWEIRLSPGLEGDPQLACALDSRLLGALRALLARHDIRALSIQPYLMAAYNGIQPMVRRRSAWLALVEPGKLCLGLLQHGRWQRLRTQRIGADWAEEMPGILEREACLLGLEAPPEEALLIAPDAAALPTDSRWAFRRIDAPVRPGALPSAAWGFAGDRKGAN